MAFIIGILLALVTVLFGRLAGFTKDRAFYPVLLVVSASYYELFAAMGGSPGAVCTEAAILGGFMAAAVMGFRSNMWIVIAGFAGHGMLDLFHGLAVANDGVPVWWPMFCMSFDAAAAAYLAVRQVRDRMSHSAIAGSPA